MFNLTLSPTKLIAFCRKFRTNRVERSYATSFLILNLLRAVSNIWKMKRYQLQPSLWVNLVPRTLQRKSTISLLFYVNSYIFSFIFSGVNSPDHSSMLSSLSANVTDVTSFQCRVRARDCTNIKTLVARAVKQLTSKALKSLRLDAVRQYNERINYEITPQL